MRKSQTYNSIVAFLLAGLLIQVFVLQGLHAIDHEHGRKQYHDDFTALAENVHDHLSCQICNFTFSPADIDAESKEIKNPLPVQREIKEQIVFLFISNLIQDYYLRGPPVVVA